MKKVLYILPALLLLWGAGFYFAHADTLIATQGYPSNSPDNYSYGVLADYINGIFNGNNNAFQILIPSGINKITDIKLLGLNGDSCAVAITTDNGGTPIGGSYVYQGSVENLTSDGWHDFYVDATVTPGSYLWMGPYAPTSGLTCGFGTWGASPTGNYITGMSNSGNPLYLGAEVFGTGPPVPSDTISISAPTNGATAIIPTSTIIHYSTSATSTIPNVESYHVYSRLWTTDPNTYVSAGGYFDPNAEPNGATTTISYPSTLQLAGATTYTEQSYLDYCVSGMTFTCYPLASSSLVAFSTPYSNSANDQVAITAPAASSTTSNLQSFGLNFKSTFTGFNYEVDVNVSTSSAMTSSTLAGVTYTGGQSSLTSLLVANNMPMASGTTYYAQASSIYYPGGAGVGAGNLVATSSVISFTASADYAGNPSFYIYGTSTPPTPSSTATSSAWTLDCTNYGLVGNSLCSVLGWLFVPPANVLNAYLGTIQLIKTKAPFGYFFIIANDIQQINDSSTPAFSFESSGVLSQFSGAFGLADEYLGIGLVVLFMFWLFHRFRKIQL